MSKINYLDYNHFKIIEEIILGYPLAKSYAKLFPQPAKNIT